MASAHGSTARAGGGADGSGARASADGAAVRASAGGAPARPSAGGTRVTRRGTYATSRRPRPSAVARSRATPLLFLLPAFAVYAAFALYPLGRAAQFSLFEWRGFGASTFVGLQNYVDLAGDAAFRAAIGNALVLIVFYAVIPLVVGLVLAAILRRGQVRGMGFFRTVIFLPQVIALVVVAVAWRQIYSPVGPLNQVLEAVGLGGAVGGSVFPAQRRGLVGRRPGRERVAAAAARAAQLALARVGGERHVVRVGAQEGADAVDAHEVRGRDAAQGGAGRRRRRQRRAGAATRRQ